MLRPFASSSRRPRWSGGALVSCILHAAVVTAAVAASSSPAPVRDRPTERTITFHDHTQPPPPVAETPATSLDLATVAPPLGTPVLPPLLDVPTNIPEVPPASAAVRPDEWNGGAGVAGGRPDGTGSSAADAASGTFAAWQVEQPAMAAPGSPAPRYPELLRSAGVDGEVVVSFVVDTTGRVEAGSIAVLRTTHELFAAAVRQALPAMRFLPAEVGGRKVRQLVQQPFVFAIGR